MSYLDLLFFFFKLNVYYPANHMSARIIIIIIIIKTMYCKTPYHEREKSIQWLQGILLSKHLVIKTKNLIYSMPDIFIQTL
jgi:hypothetical protein